MASTITAGSDGLPIIAFNHFFCSGAPPCTAGSLQSELRVIRCGNVDCDLAHPNFSNVVLDSDIGSGSNTTGLLNRITLAPDGLPVIIYTKIDQTSGKEQLKLIKCSDSKCTPNMISVLFVSSDRVSTGPALTIGPEGLPFLAFRNDDLGHLQFFRCGSSRCIPYWTRR